MAATNSWWRVVSVDVQEIGSSNLKMNLNTHVQKPRMLARWEKRGISKDKGTSMDWESNDAAIRALPITQRHWLTEQVSGMCGVGKMIKIWGLREMDECPPCREKESMFSSVETCRQLNDSVT